MLNKADTCSDEQKEEAVAYLNQEFPKLSGDVRPISAIEAWEAAQKNRLTRPSS
ncbi:MAG: hypothetical protein M5R36_05520 [Deltaproteobacteria bacterium]|nr:hypothetical protein [Deltaproteobacteria bacterium]